VAVGLVDAAAEDAADVVVAAEEEGVEERSEPGEG